MALRALGESKLLNLMLLEDCNLLVLGLQGELSSSEDEFWCVRNLQITLGALGLGVKIQGSGLCLNDVMLTEEGNLFPTCRVYFVSIDHSSIIVREVEIFHQDGTWSAS
jgi:hypothetical protein